MGFQFVLLVFGVSFLAAECGLLSRDESQHVIQARREEGWAVCIEDDVDAYFDKVLEKASKDIPEPMRLPPRRTFVDLCEGRIWGMRFLKRNGPFSVECRDDNQTAVISGQITTDEIKARYTWEKEIMGKVHTGFVLVVTNDFLADVRIVIQKGTHPELEKFKIRRFKDVRVEMTGMGILSWALGEITTMMSGILHWAIAKSIQSPLQEAIQRELREITIT